LALLQIQIAVHFMPRSAMTVSNVFRVPLPSSRPMKF